jgi:hypothetical protein
MPLQVESVADYRGVETPRRFHLDGRTVEIVESADQWHGADYRYFKVKGDDGNVYILRFDEPSGEWELTMLQSPQAETLATQVYRERQRRADGM